MVVALKVGTDVKLSLTTTLTEFEYDVHAPLVVDTRYEYVPTVSLYAAEVPLPPTADQLAPPSVERSHAIVPVAFATDTNTLPLPEHTGVDVVKVTVPATGAGLTITVTVGDEVTVEHGEFVARTNTLRVTALDDEFVNVKSNDVVPPITVNECHVAWLSSEYS